MPHIKNALENGEKLIGCMVTVMTHPDVIKIMRVGGFDLVIDAILSVPGIDAAFVGPNDLSQNYGLMGQFEHPTVVNAIEKVIASAKKHGKHSGIHMGAPEQVKKWMKQGMTLNLWANELALMVSAAEAGLRKIREKS